MTPKLKRVVNDAGDVVGWSFYCPACKRAHIFYTDLKHFPLAWTFDGNVDSPTFSPSLLLYTPEVVDSITGEKIPRAATCHLVLTAGVINYCGDCPHELAGKSVALVDWPTDW